MSAYTTYHPKWYRRRVSVWWWLEKRCYALFVLREISSVFVAFFAVVTLVQVRALAAGPAAYSRFLERLATPLLVGLHALAFLFVLYHAVTWFNLAPKAMAVSFGGRRLPDAAVAGANYAAWLLVSAGLAFLLLRG